MAVLFLMLVRRRACHVDEWAGNSEQLRRHLQQGFNRHSRMQTTTGRLVARAVVVQSDADLPTPN